MTADVKFTDSVLDAESPSSTILLSPPRAAWIEFLLHFSTFGLYTSFWLVRRMQEFKRIYTTDSRPWLWLFVPFIVLAQLIALPRFVGFINRLERESGITEWSAWRGAWYLFVILLTLATNIADKYEFPWWFLPVCISSWAALFTVVHCRIDAAKKNQTTYGFLIRRRSIAIPETIILIVMLPVSLLLCFVLAKDGLLNAKLEKLESGSVYQDSVHQFKLSIESNDWHRIEVGTYSNGDAVLELQGPLSDMYFIVFQHAVDDSVNDIAYSRQNEIMEETPASKCKHVRMLNTKGDGVIAKIICTSTIVTNPVLETVTVVETPKGVVEMYGYMTSVKNTFADYRADFEKMAAGIESL